MTFSACFSGVLGTFLGDMIIRPIRRESILGSSRRLPRMPGRARPPRNRAFIFSMEENVSVRSGFSAGPWMTSTCGPSNTRWQQSRSPSSRAPNCTVAWKFANDLCSLGSSSRSTCMVGKTASRNSLAAMRSCADADMRSPPIRRSSPRRVQIPCPSSRAPCPPRRWRRGRSRRRDPRRSRWRRRYPAGRAF